MIWSPVDSQLETDATTSARAADPDGLYVRVDSQAAYMHIKRIRVPTEVSGMVLTSGVLRYTHAALQLLSHLQHSFLHTPATPQLPAAVSETQVTINIFTSAHSIGFPGSERPRWLNIQYTVTCTTGVHEPGTSIASADPTPTAVVLQPLVQWTDLFMDDVFQYGTCHVEDTLVSNESFTSHTNGANMTGQCTLSAQDTDEHSNYMSSFTLLNLQSIAACCSRLHAAFDVTVIHLCLMFSCSCSFLNCETHTCCLCVPLLCVQVMR